MAKRRQPSIDNYRLLIKLSVQLCAMVDWASGSVARVRPRKYEYNVFNYGVFKHKLESARGL